MSIQDPHSFDSYAHTYEHTLDRGLAISGETVTFFARERIAWLGTRLQKFGLVPRTVLDYGCGTGNSTSFFVDILGTTSVIGLDLSAKSLAVARLKNSRLPVQYRLIPEYAPNEAVDLVFCNGVFHHIPVGERAGALGYMSDCVRPDGVVALWENNPWNPGTRYIMRRIPFDRDAVPMTARQARALAIEAHLKF